MRRRPILLLACLAIATAAPAAAAHPHRDGGNAIAFSFITDASQDILTVFPGGGGLRNLTHVGSGQGAEGAAWDPTGRHVYFDSDIAGGIHAFAVDAQGRHITQLTSGAGTEFAPRIAPDGRLVALEHENADLTVGGVFLARRTRDGLADLRRLTTAPALAIGGFDTPGDFSPDGSQVAFLRVLSTTRPDARSAVFVIGIDGRRQRQVTPYEVNASPPRWSPDGSRLLFSSNWDNFTDQRNANVYSVRPDGTHLVQITREPVGDHAFTPDWSPEARQIVYGHASAGQDHTELWIRELATGRTSVAWSGASETGVLDPDWSP
jgi:Tol biopolymer transport system component